MSAAPAIWEGSRLTAGLGILADGGNHRIHAYQIPISGCVLSHGTPMPSVINLRASGR